MCPDHDLVSAYVDGEVPSPWREHIEEHLATCKDCAAVAAAYTGLGARLRSVASGDEAESLAHGRLRLDSLLRDSAAPAKPIAGRRFVNLPLPVAAAAAILVLVLGTATTLLALKPSRGTAAIQTVASGEISPLATEAKAQPASMDELLRYLDARDGQVTLTIKLPSGTTFGSAGKPVIMRSGRVVRGTPVGGRSP